MRLAILATCLALAAISSASAAPIVPAAPLVFDIEAHQSTLPGDTVGAVGSRIVWADRLLQNGAAVGADSGICTATGADVFTCSVVFLLPGGTLSSVFAYDETGALTSGSDLPLFGGTGAYAGKTGTATHALAAGTATLTITLN